jgi:hypothetical protein
MPLAVQPEQELTQNFVSTDDDPQVAKFPFMQMRISLLGYGGKRLKIEL